MKKLVPNKLILNKRIISKLWFSALGSLAFCALLPAQSNPVDAPQGSHVEFASTSAAHAALFDNGSYLSALSHRNIFTDVAPDSVRLIATSWPSPAGAVPFAGPSFPPESQGSQRRPVVSEFARWQVATGVGWERFRSNVFNASAVGINTTVTHFFRDWIGLDGQVAALFAPAILPNEHVKLVNYGVGPRVSLRGHRLWEPFGHVLLGGAHELPQVAAGGKNGFLIQAGGGADYRLLPLVSLRAEADYLRTSFFSASQSNFFLSAGVVFNF